MRSKRVMKFRSQSHPLTIIIKITLICYVTIFSVSYLTSGTSAHFSSHQQVTPVITAGDWDQGVLAFLGEKRQNLKTCPAEIEAVLKNEGQEDMQKESTYEIYYVQDGVPEKREKKIKLSVEEGIIKALKSDEETKLTYETNVSGMYVFVAYQLGVDREEERSFIKRIEVECSADKQQRQEKPSTNIDNNQATTNGKKIDQKEESQSGTKVDQPAKSEKIISNEEVIEPKASQVPDEETNVEIEEEDQAHSSTEGDE